MLWRKRFITLENLAFATTLLGLILALTCNLFGLFSLSHQLLFCLLTLGTLPFVYRMLRAIWHHQFGIDLIAIVSIVASLATQEYIAGCVILIMLSGGEVLDQYAQAQARKGLTRLLSSAPTQAHRKLGEQIDDIPVGAIHTGDLVLIKQGELIPVDGIVIHGQGSVDESSLTGESLPVEKTRHSQVMSGSLNLSGTLEVHALRPSHASQYQQIIKLVHQAEVTKAPFIRLADRYSLWFTLVTLTLALLAWGLTHDPLRALAVLVVATPCPLLLAAPIAFISGISRAAQRGIIVKDGASLEKLAASHSLLLDKTGTLTLGTPQMIDATAFGQYHPDTIINLSASLDQLSTHILARALTAHAQTAHLDLTFPTEFTEFVGQGVIGKLDHKTYLFGSLAFLAQQQITVPPTLQSQHETWSQQGTMSVYLATTTTVIGVIHFADQVRDNVAAELAELVRVIPTIVMATGDKQWVAHKIAIRLGIHDVRAQCLPADKLSIIHELALRCGPVIMVGDGVNDAPALAAADVGIVLGSKSSTVAHEAGDIVVVVDTFERIREIIQLAKKVMYVARQCIAVGIGLSILLMLAAALGLIRPVVGAILQELIDVLVIINALRVQVEPYATRK